MGWEEKAKKALARGTARVLARAGWAGEKERAVASQPRRPPIKEWAGTDADRPVPARTV